MPILPTLPDPDIKQFFMPSTHGLPEDQQAWVKMDVSPLNAQDYLVAEIGESQAKTGLRVLAQRIKEWNFTEADLTPIPINDQTILRLDQRDMAYLSEQLPKTAITSQLNADQKKS